MPYDAEKAGDVKEMKDKLEKTYKSVSDTAARQAIHVFNSVLDDTGDEGSAWGAVHSTMQKRGLAKKSSRGLIAIATELRQISAELGYPFEERRRYGELYQKAADTAGYAIDPYSEMAKIGECLTKPEFEEFKKLFQHGMSRGVHASDF